MAPQPFVNQTLGPAELQSCNSVLKAYTSKTQAVVILFRQLTEKTRRFMLPILRWTLFQSGVIWACLEASGQLSLQAGKTITLSNLPMNSRIPSPQVYIVCLRGGQETRQRSLTH